jgi:hypothetical protein
MQSVNSFDLAQFPVAVAAADEAIAIVLDLGDPLRPGRTVRASVGGQGSMKPRRVTNR